MADEDLNETETFSLRNNTNFIRRSLYDCITRRVFFLRFDRFVEKMEKRNYIDYHSSIVEKFKKIGRHRAIIRQDIISHSELQQWNCARVFFPDHLIYDQTKSCW